MSDNGQCSSQDIYQLGVDAWSGYAFSLPLTLGSGGGDDEDDEDDEDDDLYDEVARIFSLTKANVLIASLPLSPIVVNSGNLKATTSSGPRQ
jgi:hypothetical protein